MGVRIHKAILVLALAAGAATPAFAGWQDQASPVDAQRLDNLPAIRQQAIAAAQQGGGKGDFSAIRSTLQPDGHAVPQAALTGSWRCRQMKLGGMMPYIVYTWFRCSIRPMHGGLFFEKSNGTQKTEGFLYPERGAWVYLGASSAKNEPWHRYSGNGASIGADVTPDDQIGLLTGIGNNHLRLEIPAVQESILDVIELER